MTALISAVAGLASGIFIRSLFVFGWPVPVFLGILAAMFTIAYRHAPRLSYLFSALFISFAALGMLRTIGADAPLPADFSRDVGNRVSYEGVVMRDADVRDATERIAVRVRSGASSVGMLVVTARDESVRVGDTVRIRGTLDIPESFMDDNGRTFRYDRYLQSAGIRYVLNYASLSVVTPAPWYSLPSALSHANRSFVRGVQAALPEPHASLASGIVIGGKSGLGRELQDEFVRSGLIQIVVLSGYNVMVVAEWVMLVLARFALPRRATAVVGALALLLFLGLAGGGSTAVRASIMALIALYARATGKTYAAGRALAVAVVIMLLLNPLYLVFDPGFGLSVVATAGLIWFADPLASFLSRFISARFWRDALATTLAAQMAVLPLLLYDTGVLSFAALPANLLVLPVVPLAMGMSALAGLTGMASSLLLPTLAPVLGLPAYAATSYVLSVAHFASNFDLSALIIPPIPFAYVMLAYAFMAAVCIYGPRGMLKISPLWQRST